MPFSLSYFLSAVDTLISCSPCSERAVSSYNILQLATRVCSDHLTDIPLGLDLGRETTWDSHLQSHKDFLGRLVIEFSKSPPSLLPPTLHYHIITSLIQLIRTALSLSQSLRKIPSPHQSSSTIQAHLGSHFAMVKIPFVRPDSIFVSWSKWQIPQIARLTTFPSTDFHELMGIRNRMTAFGIKTSAVDEVISGIVKVFASTLCWLMSLCSHCEDASWRPGACQFLSTSSSTLNPIMHAVVPCPFSRSRLPKAWLYKWVPNPKWSHQAELENKECQETHSEKGYSWYQAVKKRQESSSKSSSRWPASKYIYYVT